MGLMPKANPTLAKSHREAATARSLAAFQSMFTRDPTLTTAMTQRGLQVNDFAIVDGAVGSVALSDLSVTTAKIGNTQVTNGKLATGAVDAAKTAFAGQATVGGAGGAAPVPANPDTYLLIRDSGGVIRAVPAFATA